MQRDTHETVTVEILIPTGKNTAQGEVLSDGELVPVRVFSDQDLKDGTTFKKVDSSHQQKMLRYVEIVRAIDTKDWLAAKNACLALRSNAGAIGLGVTKALLDENPSHAQTVLTMELSRQLENVRLILWHYKARMIPSLLCPDLDSAFLVRILMSATGASAGIRLCPNCGEVFIQKRPDQDYCSIRCREAHRMARFRARKKLNPARSKRGRNR